LIKIILKFLISLIILLPISIAVHEAGHYLFGLISSDIAGSIVFASKGIGIYFPGSVHWFTPYAGVLFAFAGFLPFYFILQKRAPETSLIVLSLSLVNFAYGIYEGTPKSNILTPNLILISVAFVLMLTAALLCDQVTGDERWSLTTS